jgi:PAS domain S-box-containing protein
MSLRDAPIRRKLMRIMMLTSGLVLLLTCAAFLSYELLTFRQTAVRELSTVGRIIAANSTASLAFQNPDDAREVMAALKADPHIVGAVLYDAKGRLFAVYPEDLAAEAVPAVPEGGGFRFAGAHLGGYEAVVEDGRRLGTLYLRADMGAMYDRLRLYAGIALLVIAVSFLAAYLVARKLQSQISQPILALAETATAISERRDYSVRAPRLGKDELGLLTDAFNQMLTRIHQQNRELKESEGRVRAVVNSALSAVVVTDQAGVITDWNARAEAIFGFSREAALGRPLEETLLPAASRKAYRRTLEHSLQTADGEGAGANLPVEMTALHRDGREFPVELAVSPLRTAAAVSFCSFITDITERKRADDRLHAQLARHGLLNRITRAIGERQDLTSIFQVVGSTLEDNLPIAFGCVCLYDPSREGLTVSGMGSRGAALAVAMGMPEGASLPIDNNGLSRCLRGELVYEPETSALQFPFPQRLAGQGLRSVIVAPLLLESQVFGVLIAARRESHGFSSPDCEFLRQLSEHVALAAHQAQIHGALQRAYDDLRHSQQAVLQHERLRALGEMASGIAHDINNAISPVALYTQLLLDTEPHLSQTAREYLQTIERAIEDVAATVARMREFYRPREPEVNLAPTSLNTLAQQVLDLTRARWSNMPQQAGVVIATSTDLAPDLPTIVAAENEIREALTNLIFNAVDAMPEGGRLTVRTRLSQSEPDTREGPVLQHAHVEVSDTGRGMDEETRRRCFEPFFTTKGERGTGLGLAMVYGIVQRHSADIAIESTPGQGTTVRLSFAISGAPLGADEGHTFSAPRPLRILVVDDDPLLLKSLRDTLENYGHKVAAAGGGQEAIQVFREAMVGTEPFAVVITDLGMPYVDGRHVARAVKEMSPTTPVIMLTGWGQRMADEGDLPDHVDRVLSKPPRLRELNAALVEYCRPTRARETP